MQAHAAREPAGPDAAAEPAGPAAAAAAAAAAPPREHVDVAVVGGGPSGLLAARALLAVLPAGAAVKVYEAASGYTPQGAGVLIEINGWRALHAVDGKLADRLRSRGILITGSSCFNEAGEPLPINLPGMDHEGSVREHGHTAVMVHWGDIRQELYGALPAGTVSFATRLVGLTPGTPGGQPAVLQLQEVGGGGGAADGAAGGRVFSVTAGLVVAADGFYSRTKRVAFGAEGPPLLPSYRDKVVWRALVSYPTLEQVPELLREAGDQHRAIWWFAPGQPPKRTALVYPVNDNRFVWTTVGPASDIEAAGLPAWSPDAHRAAAPSASAPAATAATTPATTAAAAAEDLGIQQIGSVGADAKARCLAVFGRHPAALRDLLSRTDPAAITEHGYHTHDVATIRGAPDWVRGNVVAVGDAAHTGPPDGMGLNMALEDVAVLADCVAAAGGPTEQALEQYCARRLPRVHEVWGETDMRRPRRAAAVRASAFRPLGPYGSGEDKTGPPGLGAAAAAASLAKVQV